MKKFPSLFAQFLDEYYPIVCVAMLIALSAMFGFALTKTKIETVNVAYRYWQMEQLIQDYQPRNQESWDEDVPSDAYMQNCVSKERGSGSDSYYDWYCYYTVDRWENVFSVMTNGGIDIRPFQPEPTTRCTDVPEYGCQRYGVLLQTYLVYFYRPSDESSFGCNYDRALWESLDEPTYEMYFGWLGNEARCGIVEGQRPKEVRKFLYEFVEGKEA